MIEYTWNNKKLRSFQNKLKTQVEQGDKISEQDLQTLIIDLIKKYCPILIDS